MLFRVDFKSGKPVYAQLVAQIRAAAAGGALRPGETLPAIGELAGELRVNRNAVAKAYAELEAGGIVELTPGHGYRLKEGHRPLRKEVTRVADAASQRPKVRQMIHATLTYSLLTFLLGGFYFAVVALLGIAFVNSRVVQTKLGAVVATALVAAAVLPLRSRVQRALERILFPKRQEVPRALESLKAEFWSHPDLASFVERAVEMTEAMIGVRPTLIQQRSEILSLVNSFPALRSSREPVRAGNDLLMPLFSHDEVLAVLHVSPKSAHHGYDPEDWEFLTGVGEQVATAATQLRARNERVESEYALDIQRGLLPREIPQAPGLTIAAAWQPARNVGGDYYDVFRIGGDELALVIADVSGKGMPAALLMSNVQAATKAHAAATRDPKELCARVNRAICDSISAGKFITFFYAVLDSRQRTLTYTNAGHNPPLIVSRDGTSRKLETGGMVLGIFADATYEQATVEFADGDRLLIFTDGVVEAADARAKEFGEERLFTAMSSNANASAGELRDSIMEAVTHFCAGDFADDVTLLAIVVEAQAAALPPIASASASAAGGT